MLPSLSRFPDHPNRSKLRGIHLKNKSVPASKLRAHDWPNCNHVPDLIPDGAGQFAS